MISLAVGSSLIAASLMKLMIFWPIVSRNWRLLPFCGFLRSDAACLAQPSASIHSYWLLIAKKRPMRCRYQQTQSDRQNFLSPLRKRGASVTKAGTHFKT
jgi:hypothetical protein